MLLYKTKKNQAGKGSRFLISITVLGSAGPIRFVVNEDEVAADVIETALKCYAREGRLPRLGSEFDNFVLYCPTAGTEALSPWEMIGSLGVRNFVLFKKPQPQAEENSTKDGKQSAIIRKSAMVVGKGTARSWKAWFNKSLNGKIVSH